MSSLINRRLPLSEILQRGITQLGVTINHRMQQKLLDYLDLLIKWNKVYNLTAIRDPHKMVINHLFDSLAVLPHLTVGRWLDVGCGAGLPGLVLAICQVESQFTLMDSNSKKTGFVQQAVIELDLKNVEVRCARVEEFQTSDKYNGIISRAFTELGDFIQITRHLIAEGGCWVAMKGLPESELARVPKDCVVEKIIQLSVPGLDAARCLVVVTPKGELEL
ncbi:MAG: 16S rRNA (guanine(527)-N(7))-methyltransferase RsmG [Gallionella sp.]